MSITIFSPSGEATEYRTVSERLPDFQKMFPLSEGYRVIRTHVSGSDYSATIHEIWIEALKAGKNPLDIGLPRISGMSVVFEASLYLKEVLIANASAYKVVSNPKDWEAGETAAFQRLMAACGLGGSDMDMDDQHDRISSGLERQPAPKSDQPVRSPETVSASTTSTQSNEDAQSAASAPHRAEQASHELPPETASNPSPKPKDETVQTTAVRPSDFDDAVRPQLLNQLNHAASLAGEPVPQVADNAEARKEIKRLTRKAQGK